MAIAVLAPDEVIPVDHHRILVAILPEPVTEEVFVARLTNAGVAVSFITEVEDTNLAGTQTAYSMWIEPKVSGATTRRIQENLGALSAAVTREAPAYAVEAFHDAYLDVWMQKGGAGSLHQIAGADETLPAGLWFFARAGWAHIAPSPEQLQDLLDDHGIQVVAAGKCIPADVDANIRNFLINTGSMDRTPEQIMEILGAVAILVNRHAVKGNVAELCEISDEDLDAGLGDLADQAKRTIAALTGFLLSAGQAGEIVLKVMKYGLIGGLVVGGLWLGKKGYDMYQESK